MIATKQMEAFPVVIWRARPEWPHFTARAGVSRSGHCIEVAENDHDVDWITADSWL